MNPAGKSSGGGSKGKASKGKASGGDVITTQHALQTQRSHLLVLRKALQTDEGRDKDVTQPFAAFMKFNRNGLDAELKFATGAKLEKNAQRGAKKLVELLAKDALSECGLTIEDKVADFKEAAARFLFAYGPAKSEDDDKPVIAVCHFRLTLAGELQEVMEGDPVLLVADLFVAPEAQRKGLGSHMLNLCQLIARGNGLTGVQVAMYTALARSAEPWLMKKQKGFELDVTWTPDADTGITAYFKPAVVVKSAAASPASPAAGVCQPAASSPDSVLSASAASPASPAAAPAAREEAPPQALASQFEKVSVQDDAAAVPFWQRVTVPAAPAETVESASDSEDEGSEEESEEDDDERAERILDELATMFEERHGRPPTADEVEQWKATLNEASAEAAAAESR